MIRVAIAGCGAVSRLYYQPALSMLEREGRLLVAAAYDPDLESAQSFCRSFGTAHAMASFEEMIGRPLDLLIIASPPPFHRAQATAAFDAGLAVLCEKPLALTVEDGEQMVEAARRAGRPLAVGMIRRRLRATRMIRAMLSNGTLGTLRSIDIFEGGPFDWPVRSPAYFDRHAGGVGVFGDIGTHVMDLLRWWLGTPDRLAYADDAMGGIEANCRLELAFGDCTVRTRLSRDWFRPNLYRFVGDRGWMIWPVDQPDQVELGLPAASSRARLAVDEMKGAEDMWAGHPAGPFGAAFASQVMGIAGALDGGPDDYVNGDEGLAALRLVESCRAVRTAMAMPWLK
ncbi:MAG TPA: Gfo/Idh/MocA family oxidoreductase [Allosphingosinicella sp.]|nr:Gfo/Idh/MocA family oxidoreductase [Allosphingosinicella sp.]